jgi:hypothetical protein
VPPSVRASAVAAKTIATAVKAVRATPTTLMNPSSWYLSTDVNHTEG